MLVHVGTATINVLVDAFPLANPSDWHYAVALTVFVALWVCRCRYVFQTEAGTPFIFTGTGTGGWESALTNTLSPGKDCTAALGLGRLALSVHTVYTFLDWFCHCCASGSAGRSSWCLHTKLRVTNVSRVPLMLHR